MPDGGSAGSRVEGTLLAADGRGIVRMEDRYDTSIDDLWSALTDPQRLARWVAKVSGDLRPGGVLRASFTSGWQGPGRLDECEPPRRLLLTLDPEREDQTVIEAELFAEGDQTRLVVEERDLPLGELAAHGAGCKRSVMSSLAYLEGRDHCVDWLHRWIEITPSYRLRADGLA